MYVCVRANITITEENTVLEDVLWRENELEFRMEMVKKAEHGRNSNNNRKRGGMKGGENRKDKAINGKQVMKEIFLTKTRRKIERK